MTSILLPTLFPELNEVDAANSPFHQLGGYSSRAEFKAAKEAPASERRLMSPHFRDCFAWEVILPLLPLRLVVPEHLPAWQSRQVLSHYQWLPPDDIQSPADLAKLDDFDLLLRFDIKLPADWLQLSRAGEQAPLVKQVFLNRQKTIQPALKLKGHE